MKMKQHIIFLFIALSFSGCISLYPRFDKIPCSELNKDSKEDIKKIALSMGFKEKDIAVTDQYVRYHKKKTIVYADIQKAYIVTKRMLKGRRYTIVTVMKNRDKHVFVTYDFDLAIKVYSTLECLAGIPDKEEKTSPDKYNQLERLKRLLDSGAINVEEYEKEKQKILR
jgi:hypothetical protein